MNLINNISSFLTGKKAESQVRTFNLSNIQAFTDYSSLLSYDNYFDNFVGYTYLAVSISAEGVAQNTIRLYKESKGGKKEELKKDGEAILQDLVRFNEFQSLYEARLMRELHLGLAGLAYWWMTIKDYKSKEFYMLDPQRMGFIPHPIHGLPIKYKYRDVKGQTVDIPLENIIQFKKPNPKNIFEGYSPLEASKFAHNTYEEYEKHNYNFIKNDGKPNGIFVLKGATSTEVKDFEDKMKAKYQGADNAGKNGYTNADVTYINMGTNQNDMQFEQGLKRMRDDILAMHRVPLELVFGGSTYENKNEARGSFQEYNTLPKLIAEQNALNEQLIPKYYGKKRTDIYFEFDSPITKDYEKEAKTTGQLFTDGVITRNEARSREGYDTIPDGDVFIESTDIKKDTPTSDAPKKSLNNTVKKKYNKVELKTKILSFQLKEENRFLKHIQKYFSQQEKRVFNEIKSIKITSKTLGPDEDQIGINFFLPLFENLATTFNGLGSDIAEQNNPDSKPFPLSEEAKAELRTNLERFMKDINSNTKKDIAEIYIDSLENSIALEETKKRVIRLFDKYIQGSYNTNLLIDYGVYDERSVIENGSIIEGNAKRYSNMFNMIEGLQNEEDKQRALQALVNMTDENSEDSIQTAKKIKSKYKIARQDMINSSRIRTITTTETNTIKNLAIHDRYQQDETISKGEWTTAQDDDVRDAHAAADGQQIKKGEKYKVGGEELRYPGDPVASAKNRINCRCTELPVDN